MKPRQTRQIRIGNIWIGGSNPIAVQSMTATRTQDVDATIRQVELLDGKGLSEILEDGGLDLHGRGDSSMQGRVLPGSGEVV